MLIFRHISISFTISRIFYTLETKLVKGYAGLKGLQFAVIENIYT